MHIFRLLFEHPWRTFTLSIPIISVIMCIALAILSSYQNTSLVQDQYEKVGLEISRNIQNEKILRTGKIKARILIQTNKVSVQLESLFSKPTTLVLELVHPTLEHLDQTLILKNSPLGYHAYLTKPIIGHYHAFLSDPQQQWRLKQYLSVQYD